MTKRKLSRNISPRSLYRLLPVLALATLLGPQVATRTAQAQASVATDAAIPQTALVQPVQLKDRLAAGHKPVILQVGSHTLFTESHIPGSTYAGAAATPEGLATLRTLVAKLPKNAEIVLYCGCCPWGRCPNIRPAYKQLIGLGYTDVKVLYLAQDFGTDWVNKGFPTERAN